MANPTGKGGFRKGVSGNPKGRKPLPETAADVRTMAREFTSDAIAGLVKIANDRKGASASARVAAWNSLLDRGWGKAAQPLTGEDGEGEAVLRHRIDLG